MKMKLTWKIVLDYLKFFKKVQVSVHRLKFLRKCLKNDLIPDFLKFRVPENGVFSDQAVHNFQLKLLRTETSRANEDRKRYEEMLRKARSLVQKEIDKQWWASIFRFVRRQVEASLKTTSENHRKKLEKLSERQDKPLGGRNERSVRVLDNIELPEWVYEVLSMGPKHPIRDKFNETHFLADIDIFLSQLKNQKTSGETLCEIEAAAKAYAKNVRQTPRDKAVEKTRKYLKDNGLLAVPFDKGVGFCIMRKQTYESKLESLLQSAQFVKKDATTDEVILKIEKELNKELLAMNKRDEISDQLYSKIRSTGGQPARLYGLAKVHKDETPLRPVLSLPGSSYENLNKMLAKFFDNIDGANIETNTKEAREKIENIALDPDETIISLDVKSLYTNVPLKEAIEIALQKLYSQESPPEIQRATMKRLLNMAVSKVYFKCNDSWYVQVDGLAMGASLAVILANLWLKEYEFALRQQIPVGTGVQQINDKNGLCPCCSRKVTYRSKGVECESCRNWYHLKCGKISDDVYASITEIVWYCESCCRAKNKEKDTPQVKLFLRYVDDIVRTVRGEPSCILDAANSLHPNLQFTLEKTNSEGNLPFLDLNINISQDRRVTCSWYQKPTDTGTILNYRSCAPTQYKRSVIQGTVHRVFRSTSSWEQFDKAMETNRAQWLTNQYPENWSAKVASDALCKIIEGKGKPLDSDRGLSVQSPKDEKPPMLMVQYRGNQSQYFANRLRKLTNVQVVFTTRKLQSCLPSLKSAFSNDLKSRVVYKLSCSGCTSTYVGQTVRHLTTRIEEHRKADSPVGLHLQQCQLEGNSADLSWEIIDRSNNQTKLLTLEAIHIRKEKPGLNTRDEFRSRELTLKI